jgi:histidinol dehydrogenase
MKIISGGEFNTYWNSQAAASRDAALETAVKDIIAAVRNEGDAAVRRYAARFDKSAPADPEVPAAAAKAAWDQLAGEDAGPDAARHCREKPCRSDPELAAALELAAGHIRRFALEQKKQFVDFEYRMAPGLFTGQRVIPVRRAAIYAPGGRFPLISSVLMGLIPAVAAGVEEVFLVSPPGTDGLPDSRVLAAAHLAGARRIFALGGAQAIAALALGTETIPRVDLIAGPGNKYVAAAKRLLYGEVGIDFVAGPTDVLVISDNGGGGASAEAAADLVAAADLIAADMLAQAEHDPDARARALVPCRAAAEKTAAALAKRLALLPAESPAHASIEAGGLIIIYRDQDEAAGIANAIAPEHLELQTADPEDWLPALKNYGSLFIGPLAAEVLGDYSAGINHTLPTSGSARFTGGLSVRHFLKTLTTLRCAPGEGFDAARRAAETIARAEGLVAHAQSAAAREGPLSK